MKFYEYMVWCESQADRMEREASGLTAEEFYGNGPPGFEDKEFEPLMTPEQKREHAMKLKKISEED
jgi:hypothetical protein